MPALAAAAARAEGRGWTLRRSCPPYGDRRDRGGQRRGHRLGLRGAGAGAWRRSRGGRGSSAPRRGGTAESRPPAEQARRRRLPARGTARPPPRRCGRPRADAAARGCASWGARAGVGVETPQLIVGEAVRPGGVVGAYWGSASSSGDRRALYRPTAWAKRWVPTSGIGATGTPSVLRRHLTGRRTSGAAGMPKWASSSASSIVKLGRLIVGERERQGARGGEGRKRRTPATRGRRRGEARAVCEPTKGARRFL